jgi:hypothetical protein
LRTFEKKNTSEGYLDTQRNTSTEKILATDGDIFLQKEEETKAATKHIGVLITQMDTTDDMVHIAAKAAAKANISVVVLATRNTGLVTDTQLP